MGVPLARQDNHPPLPTGRQASRAGKPRGTLNHAVDEVIYQYLWYNIIIVNKVDND